jgi:hypothetical protein
MIILPCTRQPIRSRYGFNNLPPPLPGTTRSFPAHRNIQSAISLTAMPALVRFSDHWLRGNAADHIGKIQA